MASEREYFMVDRQEFGCAIDDRTGTPYVYSIHPYDETEYHWARKGTGRIVKWHVFRDGKFVSSVPNCSVEEIAERLMDMDSKAGLHRTGGIW